MQSFNTILSTQHDKSRMLESAPLFFNLSLQKSPKLSFLSLFNPFPPPYPLEYSFWADTIYSKNLASHNNIFLSVYFSSRPTDYHNYCSCTSRGDYRLTFHNGTQSQPWKSGKEPHALLNLGWNSRPPTDICNILCHLILNSVLQSLECSGSNPDSMISQCFIDQGLLSLDYCLLSHTVTIGLLETQVPIW